MEGGAYHTLKGFFASFVLFILSLGGLAIVQPRLGDGELVQALRGGGHVIVIRHGATNADMADTDPLTHDNVDKQRQLSAKVEDAARALGAAFRLIGVPLGQIYTSRFNRAYQTAKLADFETSRRV